jgi:hypothetical protein
VIESIDVDIPAHRIDLRIRADGDTVTRHVLSFDWSTEMRLEMDGVVDDPWNYTELTEIHLSRGPDGSVLTELVLWGEDTGGMSVRSARCSLDGQQIPLR